MKIKSYFSRTVEDAIAVARRELGPDAMLVNSRKAGPEASHLGAYEVVFASDPPGKDGEAAAHQAEVNDRIAVEVAELKRQLEGMRRALTKSAFAPPQWLGPTPGLLEAYSLLTANEVDPELALEIVQAAGSPCEPSKAREIRQPTWQRALAEEMQSRFRTDARIGTGQASPRIVAFVGPPGCGKTTTLVKLAVQHGLASRRPVLILSVDTYRVAAADQLRCYAAILGVGFQLLDTIPSLAQAVEENRGKELILIDTAGCAFADLDTSSDLARFLSTRKDIDRQLVVPSSMKSADLARVIDSYDAFQPQHILFTRLDETASLGPILNEAVRAQKPLSFFTTGQRIPEDLEPATPERLIGSILGTLAEQELSAA